MSKKTPRPAEKSTGLAALVAIAICELAGVDSAAVYNAVVALIGVLPGVVTWFVSRKGDPVA